MEVFYLHYADTVQASCLRLMGRKLLVSLAMEGKFTAEGLSAFEDGDDVLTALARELVTERRVGEPADAVWRMVQEQHEEHFPARTERCSRDPPQVMLPPATPEVDGTVLQPHGMTVWDRATWFCVAETGQVYRLPLAVL